MRIRLTLQRHHGDPVDLLITADPQATVGEVAEALHRRDWAGSGSDAATPTLHVVEGAGVREVPAGFPLADAGLRSGAMVRLADRGTATSSTARDSVLELDVSDGDGTMRRISLPRGSYKIGRNADSAVRFDDRSVSRHHADLEVRASSARIEDARSAAGLRVNGDRISTLDLREGQEIVLGECRIRVAVIAGEHRTERVAPDGSVRFNRSPRVEPRFGGIVEEAPAPPSAQSSQPFPWLSLIAPLVAGVALFAFTRSPLSLVFIALSPVLMVGNFVTTRLNRRRQHRIDVERFDARLDALDERLAASAVKEGQVRRAEHPSTAEVVDAALALRSLLWTRRPEHWSFLRLRLGTGTLPSRSSITTSGRDAALPGFLDRLDAVVARHESVPDVPLSESLFDAGALGVAGDRAQTAPVVRALLAQVAALHAPTEVVIAAIAGTDWASELDSLRWLPHVDSEFSPLRGHHLATTTTNPGALVAALEELVEQRARSGGSTFRGSGSLEESALQAGATIAAAPARVAPAAAPTPAVVVVIDDGALVGRERARLVSLGERAADAGVYPIWVARRPADLPAVARTSLNLGAEEGPVVSYVRLGLSYPVVPEGLSAERAASLARHLAAVQDAGAYRTDIGDVPRTVSLLAELGRELGRDADAVLERWRANGSVLDGSSTGPQGVAGTLNAFVGRSSSGGMDIDLRAHGPHALVAGTSGAGKSEFLQSWVLSLALGYSPQRLRFLFVDYKGGTAFGRLNDLPHSYGIITDLNPLEVDRALISLRSELRRREGILKDAGLSDLRELEARGAVDAPPALVIVIDEFGALVEQVPKFIDGVVDIAQRGRALGIHLVLATQQPKGVIDSKIRSNSTIRIALRMADGEDSVDVVGARDAAAFDPSIPGRAVAKVGPGRLTLFQSAYVGGRTSDVALAPEIEIAQFGFGVETRWDSPDRAAGPPADREVERAADQVADSAADAGNESAGPADDDERLILAITAAASETSMDLESLRPPWLPPLEAIIPYSVLRTGEGAGLAIGVRDRPEQQTQDTLYFVPAIDGHLAIIGTGGSGKTVALRTLAVAAGARGDAEPIDVYGLDLGGGGLSLVNGLPNVAEVVAASDEAGIARLVWFLGEELARRAKDYPGGYDDYHSRPAGRNEPRIIVLVDNLPSSAASRSLEHDALWVRIASAGRHLGVHLVVATDRAGGLSGSLSANIPRRLTLRTADDGYSAHVVAPEAPSGRGSLGGDEVQIALVGEDPSIPTQTAALYALASDRSRARSNPPRPLARIPEEDFASAAVPGELSFGFVEDSLHPVAIEPGALLFVSGSAASGRERVLENLAAAVRNDPEPSWLYRLSDADDRRWGGNAWTETAGSVEELVQLVDQILPRLEDSDRRFALFLDMDRVDREAQSTAIRRLAAAVAGTSHVVVVAAEPAMWQLGTGVLSALTTPWYAAALNPRWGETDVFGVVSRARDVWTRPGQGYLITSGHRTAVQLATAPLPQGTAPHRSARPKAGTMQ